MPPSRQHVSWRMYNTRYLSLFFFHFNYLYVQNNTHCIRRRRRRRCWWWIFSFIFVNNKTENNVFKTFYKRNCWCWCFIAYMCWIFVHEIIWKVDNQKEWGFYSLIFSRIKIFSLLLWRVWIFMSFSSTSEANMDKINHFLNHNVVRW